MFGMASPRLMIHPASMSKTTKSSERRRLASANSDIFTQDKNYVLDVVTEGISQLEIRERDPLLPFESTNESLAPNFYTT
jgi:hypothetical protein